MIDDLTKIEKRELIRLYRQIYLEDSHKGITTNTKTLFGLEMKGLVAVSVDKKRRMHVSLSEKARDLAKHLYEQNRTNTEGVK